METHPRCGAPEGEFELWGNPQHPPFGAAAPIGFLLVHFCVAHPFTILSVWSVNIMRLSTTFFLALVFTAAAPAQVQVAGRVIDEDGAPVPAARVAVHCGAAAAVEAQTGPAGDFELSLPPGDCTMNAGHAGFFELRIGRA